MQLAPLQTTFLPYNPLSHFVGLFKILPFVEYVNDPDKYKSVLKKLLQEVSCNGCGRLNEQGGCDENYFVKEGGKNQVFMTKILFWMELDNICFCGQLFDDFSYNFDNNF